METDPEGTKVCESCGRRKRKDEFSAGRRVCKACRAERERERLRELRVELLRPSPEEARWREDTRRRREALRIPNWYGERSSEEEDPGPTRRIRRHVILQTPSWQLPPR
jgi:hypothetical protein